MGNLNIGTDVIAIKDAVRQVERNITELQRRKDEVQGYAASAIIKFYDEKIDAQNVALSWLLRAL